MNQNSSSEQIKTLGVWTLLGLLVGVACGVASGVFLISLDWATRYRTGHEQMIYLLPVAGLLIGFVYDRWGHRVGAGNNLVIDTIHEGGERIPLRMTPMVLAGTVITHLFGGSAGREGTAVQMGGSLADQIAHWFRISKDTRRDIIAAGMAGGFASVFGTPIAGLVFGLEVVTVGRIQYRAMLPALIAAVVGDWTTRQMGVVHTQYPHPWPWALGPMELVKWLVFGAAVAGAAWLFIELTHGLKKQFTKQIPKLPLRLFAGGFAVVALWKLAGTSDYLGLGVPGILAAFTNPDPVPYAFALKILFTSVTLASGFVGGEVTPLFFVGATLGATIGHVLGIPLELAAGVGLAGVFAAAANTPLALSVMCVELLGANVLPHVVIVCAVAYLLTGHRGIYPAQRIGRKKITQEPQGNTEPLTAMRDL